MTTKNNCNDIENTWQLLRGITAHTLGIINQKHSLPKIRYNNMIIINKLLINNKYLKYITAKQI